MFLNAQRSRSPLIKSQRKTILQLLKEKKWRKKNNCEKRELVFLSALLEEAHSGRVTAGEQKVRCAGMHDFTVPTLMSAKRKERKKERRHFPLWVYWPGPFCLGYNDHRLSRPLLHSLWTSKPARERPEAKGWWTAGTWKGGGGVTRHPGERKVRAGLQLVNKSEQQHTGSHGPGMQCG